MHRLIRMVANAAASLVLMGCAERVNAPTAARVPAAPSFEIRDGAHNSGNPHFYFLPPIVASQQEAKNVNTGEFFPLVDGRTLPVKFRIEQGAVFVAGPSSQPLMIQTPVTAAGSSVQLVIPAGALSQPTGITVLPAMLPSGTSTSALVGGTAYDFGPTGTMFASPAACRRQEHPG